MAAVRKLKFCFTGCLVALIICELLGYADSNDDAKRLYHDLLIQNKYNKLIRPIGNNTNKPLTVKMGIRLSQIIDVDELNQVMTTNVWLRQEWRDISLQWDPEEYGTIKQLELPSKNIWLPDIVLFNNADGNYEVTLMTKATVDYQGCVVWEPPAIYKSSCTIEVEFFPFDIQLCSMRFASWTYDGNQVDLIHECSTNPKAREVIFNGIDLRDFYESGEWDILEVTAEKNVNNNTEYPDITYNVTMRRKTLFHTVNLIIPSVAISCLTILVFYLPSDSCEKITLCISILLSLNFFFLLLAEIIPPTSIVVPLIGKYLLFTMILITLSIIVTVITLNVHFRSPSTHTMAPWVRRVFLNILPKMLLMRRPNLELEKVARTIVRTRNGMEMRDQYLNRHDLDNYETLRLTAHEDLDSESSVLSEEVQEAIDSIVFIAEHLKKGDHTASIREDWKYVAMVLDRLFLWIFTVACLVGTFGIIFQAPTLYDNRQRMTPVDSSYKCLPPHDQGLFSASKSENSFCFSSRNL
ncbi:acetylcholine receptor subunit alpha-like 1 isoform X1 [Mya arenaria]|uniref:acetylcholine receptor subunit alpha-like 1 isoform X1 n=1 Tax=Mya arenaria TaxID=6604 RepID=UPI0022E5B9AE|nr:acetylcholine receptor subunit alpha-like 1 isoform X1 [Mya arenaria]XP_052793767.1 acetylcholine receptor subunit alpha-like 1 isoform X1 [Mya arenaria]